MKKKREAREDGALSTKVEKRRAKGERRERVEQADEFINFKSWLQCRLCSRRFHGFTTPPPSAATRQPRLTPPIHPPLSTPPAPRIHDAQLIIFFEASWLIDWPL